MKGIKRKLSIMSILMVLLMTVFALAACGTQSSSGSSESSSEAESAESAETSVSVDSLKTIGDAFALATEENQYAVYEGKVVFAFKYGGTYYRVRADISEDEEKAYIDIPFDDEDYEAKQHEIIDPLEITKTEDLSDQILTQEELDALAGKTGKELVDEGWTYQGSYYLDDMEVWMDYGPFEYSVKFDGSIAENSDDLDIEKETAAMKVKSAEFAMFGDATTVD